MKDEKLKVSRRNFLMAAGAGAAAGAAALAAAASQAVPGGAAAVEVARSTAGGQGDSAHRCNYYRTARL